MCRADVRLKTWFPVICVNAHLPFDTQSVSSVHIENARCVELMIAAEASTLRRQCTNNICLHWFIKGRIGGIAATC